MLSNTKSESGSIDWENWNDIMLQANACSLNEEKLFLLSAKESINTAYGFSNVAQLVTNDSVYSEDDARKMVIGGSDSNTLCSWWLRSTSSWDAYHATMIESNGRTYTFNTEGDRGLIFAVNIPTQYIIYSRSVNDYTTMNSGEHGFTEIPQTNIDTDYCFTVFDLGRRSFKTDDNEETIECTRNSEGKINLVIKYKGAETGDKEYISAIIKNGSTPLYHATKKHTQKDGSVTFELPEDIKENIIIPNPISDDSKTEEDESGYFFVKIASSDRSSEKYTISAS